MPQSLKSLPPCLLGLLIYSERATRYWAALAREWYGYEIGGDSEQVEWMHLIIADPRQHGAWASRDHMEVGGMNYGS